jgi:hypothetical protein
MLIFIKRIGFFKKARIACYENYLVGQVFVAIRLKSDVFSRGRLLKQITKENSVEIRCLFAWTAFEANHERNR